MVEVLESRIAPAAVFVSSKIATYTDVDGDLVKVSFSKAILTTGNVGSIVVETGSGLDNIDLTAAALDANNVSLAKGTTIKVEVTSVVGDGFADVAAITATGIDLGAITMLKSRLVSLDCGDDSVDGSGFKVDPTTSIALPSLKVRAFGAVGANVPQFVTPYIAKYTDIDGDLVTVKLTKALFNPTNVSTVLDLTANGIESIDVTEFGKTASGAYRAQGLGFSLTVTSVVGDGFANVGLIDATGIDLGTVTMLKTDLGKIVCGDTAAGTIYANGFPVTGKSTVIDPTPRSIALKGLTVDSMGTHGLTTQGGSGDLVSAIGGSVGTIKVTGDVTDSNFLIQRKFTSISIGGDLAGHGTAGQGSIQAEISIEKNFLLYVSGSITIGGDLVGGTATKTGYISTGQYGSLTNIKIGGDVVGGSATKTGTIETGTIYNHISNLSIGGDLIGGSGTKSGYVFSTTIGPVTIGGNIIGGTANDSGGIGSFGTFMSSLVVKGSIQGGDVSQEGVTLTNSGFVYASQLTTVTVGGSLIGGTNSTTTGTTKLNGSLRIATSSSITISGSVMGNVGIGGQETAPAILAGPSVLSIGGDVTHAMIGYGVFPSDNYAASFPYVLKVGTITVGGNLTASNISVGVGAGADLEFGTSDDALASASAGSAYAKIASIIIKGTMTGTVGGADSYGIEAEEIGKLSVHGVAVALSAGKSNDDILTGDSGDVRVRELTRSII